MYLNFTSLLSRELMRKIKQYKWLEFDPNILNTQIDDGIWSNQELDMRIKLMEDKCYSKEYKRNLEKDPISIFFEHETNFIQLI